MTKRKKYKDDNWLQPDTFAMYFSRAAIHSRLFKMSAVQLFFGAAFIPAENTDILFEVKAVLCFYFYACGDVFRRNGIVQQDCIVGNRFELKRRFPKDAANLHHTLFSLQSRHLWWDFFMPWFYPMNGKDLHRFCRRTENIHKCGIFSKSGVFCINLAQILCL